MRFSLTRKVATVAMVAGVAAAMTLPHSAAVAAPVAPPAGQPVAEAASAEQLAAMQRDLGLTVEQARKLMAREQAASHVEQHLQATLGERFAGAWLEGPTLMVAITDSAQAAQVRETGAQPRLVAHSHAQLQTTQATLDRVSETSGVVASSYVDLASNTVVVEAQPGARAEVAKVVAASGVASDAVRVEEAAESPQLFYDVRGGDAYYISGLGRCSVGFSVQPAGFVTAGHCGTAGRATSGYNQVSQGTVQDSSFPGNDYGWVAVNSNWTPRPWVNRYNGTNVIVAGSQEAAVNASVCRSGSTTGWRCGTITHKNMTVHYPQGTVYGLTRTTACAEPGDSGGSFLAGQQAQGVTSGGSGNCSSGGITFYQPLLPILAAYPNLSLVTSGAGAPPSNVSIHCESGGSQFFCWLGYTSQDPVQIQWYMNGSAWVSNQTWVSGSCGAWTTVYAVVSNQHGSTQSNTWGNCNPGPWH